MVPYDPNWVRLFEKYRDKINGIFPRATTEHVGSTAVPGMRGKSCIDVLVAVDDLIEVENKKSELEELGLVCLGDYIRRGSILYKEMDGNTALANIHFFESGHAHAKEMLKVRDYLRTHNEEAEAYSNLKTKLYSQYWDDYSSYRKHKDEYMAELVKRVAMVNQE